MVDEVLDLFIELGAEEDQLEFPVVYASGIQVHLARIQIQRNKKKIWMPLFETIIENIPAPVDNSDEPLQFQVALLDYNDYVGRIGVGRVFRGKMHVGQQVALMKLDGTAKTIPSDENLWLYRLKKVEIEEAFPGDIIAVAGMEDINVGETVCPVEHQEALPILHIDEPTLTNDVPGK